MSSTTSGSVPIGSIATSVTSSFEGVAQLVTAGSYIAGTAFAASAILEFKGQQDNPTEVPISTPLALVAVAAALAFIPTVKGGSADA